MSESFWKRRPVVAEYAGGIPMQFPSSFERYLVRSVDECAARLIELLGDPSARRAFGQAAREHVRRSYLLPRLLRDDLSLIKTVLGDVETVAPAAA